MKSYRTIHNIFYQIIFIAYTKKKVKYQRRKSILHQLSIAFSVILRWIKICKIHLLPKSYILIKSIVVFEKLHSLYSSRKNSEYVKNEKSLLLRMICTATILKILTCSINIHSWRRSIMFHSTNTAAKQTCKHKIRIFRKKIEQLKTNLQKLNDTWLDCMSYLSYTILLEMVWFWQHSGN